MLILLIPDTKSAIEVLLKRRPNRIPKENTFVFARATKGSMDHLRQGSYGSWKTWKVLEFYSGIFQDWKVLEKGHWSWKVLEIC